MNLFIVSTISCLLEYIVPILIKYITSRVYTVSKHVTELRDELVNLKHEMGGIILNEEFSKYAKLQRKCNKLICIFKETVNERLSSRGKIQQFAIYGFHILNQYPLVIRQLYL
ncbi:guided entry of tail-anchored proteins factor 1 isoform X2 [Colletes latitarsis]|uniref:guided entry of tail-anchored proteins factor 1 isoform X2 n=1 Tax=Colletes latitarsis TaxID=2605962 RepID=UPI0040350B11